MNFSAAWRPAWAGCKQKRGSAILHLDRERTSVRAATGSYNAVGHRVRLARNAASQPNGGPGCGVGIARSLERGIANEPRAHLDLITSQPLRPIDGVIQNGIGIFDEGRHAAMLLISARTENVRWSTVETRTRLSRGMATTRNSGSTAKARTSLPIAINRMPGVLAKCRMTTPSTPSSCDPPAAMPANPRTGANGATKVALPVAAAAKGRTRANCARTGADPVAVPRSIRKRAGCAETVVEPVATACMGARCQNRAGSGPRPDCGRPRNPDAHHPAGHRRASRGRSSSGPDRRQLRAGGALARGHASQGASRVEQNQEHGAEAVVLTWRGYRLCASCGWTTTWKSRSTGKELKNMHRASTVSQTSIRLRGKPVPGAEDRQRKIAGFDQELFSKSSILCIGAGGLISHIAPTLVRKTHRDLVVFNRTRERTRQLASSGIAVADSVESAVDGAKYVVLMLSDAEIGRAH